MAQLPAFYPWRSGAELADAVIGCRKALGWTQEELARRARVGSKFVYNLERGKPTLRVDKVLEVVRALGMMPLLVPGALFGPAG